MNIQRTWPIKFNEHKEDEERATALSQKEDITQTQHAYIAINSQRRSSSHAALLKCKPYMCIMFHTLTLTLLLVSKKLSTQPHEPERLEP